MKTHNASAAPAVWSNADFRRLTAGQLVSQLGNQLQFLALPLIVLSISGSATQAGTVLGLGTATYLLTGLVAGALVDRWNRKRTMIWAEVGRALLTATIPLALYFHALTITQLYVVAVLTGVLTVLFQTANTTAIPNIVSEEQVPDALGATQAAGRALGIFGAPIAGLAYALGPVAPFLFNACSFLVSALSLRTIRASFQQTEAADLAATPRPDLLGDIREGLAWLQGQSVIRLLALVEAADALRYGVGYLLIIELARHTGADAVQIGLVFSGAAVGGLLGGVMAARVTRRWPLGQVAIVMLWVEALAFPLYAAAPSWLWLAAVALLESVIAPVYSVAIDTYRLAVTPDRLRGRVNSAIGTVLTGASAVGTILGGLLLTRLGAPTLTLVCAGWLAGLALLATASRGVRTARMPTPTLD